MDRNSASLSKDILLKIIEHLQDSVFVTDGEGKIILVNAVAINLLEVSAEEMVGYTVLDMLKKGYWSNSTVLQAIEKRKAVSGPIYCKNGTKNISTSIPIFSENGKVDLVITSSSGEQNFYELYKILKHEQIESNRYKRELEFLKYSKEKKIVAESPSMKKSLSDAALAARMDNTIIIMGETGVGKDIIANYIHANSERRDNAFVGINCAAISENLFNAELFGYEKGSFTGASSTGKMGLFEVAKNGTIFLDEIAELPLPIQAKLLRVLESKTFRRVGGTVDIKSTSRILCATNRDLKKMVDEGLFRNDLYYRLNEFTITVVPLRKRKEDILPLADLFLESYNRKYHTHKYLSSKMKKDLLNYFWPGNIRELRNVISRAYIIVEDEELNMDLIILNEAQDEEDSENQKQMLDECVKNKKTLKEFCDKVESMYIDEVIKQSNGNISEAAKNLGINRSHLYRKLAR